MLSWFAYLYMRPYIRRGIGSAKRCSFKSPFRHSSCTPEKLTTLLGMAPAPDKNGPLYPYNFIMFDFVESAVSLSLGHVMHCQHVNQFSQPHQYHRALILQPLTLTVSIASLQIFTTPHSAVNMSLADVARLCLLQELPQLLRTLHLLALWRCVLPRAEARSTGVRPEGRHISDDHGFLVFVRGELWPQLFVA